MGSVTQTDFGYTGQRNIADIGLMDYRARMYDSLIGRFIQPDSIVPGAANSQAFNRYAYVINNPIGYNDPTGRGNHCDGYHCKIQQNQINKNNGSANTDLWAGASSGFSSGNITLSSLMNGNWGSTNGSGGYSGSQITLNSITSSIGSGSNGGASWLSDPTFWNHLSVITQDASMMVSMAGAGIEGATTAIGCFTDFETGFLPGCATGAALGKELYDYLPVIGPFSANTIQANLSFYSTGFAVASDILSGDTRGNFFNPSTWVIGESTATSVTTSVLSIISDDPFVDTILNGYGSGYNHGFFCGIYSLSSCIQRNLGGR